MWFINDVTIKEIEPSEDKVLKICSENNIKVGTAWSKSKFLGRVISNEDYQKLIRALKKTENIKKINNMEKIKFLEWLISLGNIHLNDYEAVDRSANKIKNK